MSAPNSANRARAVRATRRPPEAEPRRPARAIRPDGRDARGRARGKISRRSAARDERAGGDVKRERACGRATRSSGERGADSAYGDCPLNVRVRGAEHAEQVDGGVARVCKKLWAARWRGWRDMALAGLKEQRHF